MASTCYGSLNTGHRICEGRDRKIKVKMPVAKPDTSKPRIIAHVDMDCFYVQVEQRRQPELRGLPSAVVQYNSWKGGGLIAVSYEARKYGVKRSMRGEEAKQVCPQIQLVQVPVARGKADLNVYRNAGSEVVSILARSGRCERASIDEVYLDLTDAAETMLAETPPENFEAIDGEALKSHVLGLNDDGGNMKEVVKSWLCRSDADHRDKLLACGVFIVAGLRMQVLTETKFTCSAGIAHNKMLAKLASGMNKPAQQTVVPLSSVKDLLQPLPIKKMKQLGGKLGSSLECHLNVHTVGDLLQFSEVKLQEFYGINTGTWLWNIARGISGEEVQGRLLPKSHGSGKTFPGPRALKTIPSIQHWLSELCEELSERLSSDFDLNKRMAQLLTLHARAYKSSDTESQNKFPSKSCPLRYGADKIKEDALNLFQSALREFLGPTVKTQGTQSHGWGITSLSVSAGKIVVIPSGTCSIMKYFHGQNPDSSSKKLSHNNLIVEATASSQSGSEHLQQNLTDSYIELAGQDISIHDVMPIHWSGKENCAKTSPESISGKEQTCCSSKPVLDGITNKASLSSATGGENYLELNGIKPHMKIPGNELVSKDGLLCLEQQEDKRNTFKHKRGTSSILKFFQNCNSSCSSPNQDHQAHAGTNASSSLGSQFENDAIPGLNQAEPSRKSPLTKLGGDNGSRSGQNGDRREIWSYKIDEIDHSVIEELPPEVQREVQAWLRPQKRANIARRGSSIAHYFLPSKKA